MKISIFYSSEDTDEMELVRTNLYAVKTAEDDIWCDRKLEGGKDWREQIVRRLQETDVSILLISKPFFKSLYVQLFEHPTSKVRETLGLTSVIPILIENLTSEKLARYHWWEATLFKNSAGKLVPFKALGNEEKRTRLKEALDLARAKIKPERNKETEELPPLDLRSDARQRKAAELLLQEFSEIPYECIEAAVDGYLTLRKIPLDGMERAKRWGAQLEIISQTQSITPGLRDILTLLKIGLPESPVHLENFAPAAPSHALIMTPGMASLLRGLKILEKGDFFEAATIIESRSHISCALAQCALGQCYRKKDRLDEAETHLKEAGRLAEEMDEKCECGLGCPKNSILAEAHRGRGTILRKRGDFERAEGHFAEALRISKAPDVPKRQKAGIHFSYGYFLLERGICYYDGRTGGANEVQSVIESGLSLTSEPGGKAIELLELAENHFDAAIALNSKTGPARARKAIVQHLLSRGSAQDFIEGALHAGTGGEGKLTKFFCSVGKFIYQENNKQRPSQREMFEVANMLKEIYRGTEVVAEGPRQCHAFDLQLVLAGFNLRHLSKEIDAAARLLIASASWHRETTLSEQHALTNELLGQ